VKKAVEAPKRKGSLRLNSLKASCIRNHKTRSLRRLIISSTYEKRGKRSEPKNPLSFWKSLLAGKENRQQTITICCLYCPLLRRFPASLRDWRFQKNKKKKD
jgi:hypothetical protein